MRLLALVLPLATTLAFFPGAAAAQTAQASPVTEIRVPGRAARARIWTEPGPGGARIPYTSLSLDGRRFSAGRPTDYDLRLRFERFDPLRRRPRIPADLRATRRNRLAIVQYWTQGIEDYRDVVRGLGAEIHLFLANHSNVVEMSPATARAVAQLPFVRSVKPYHPAYKLEERLLEAVASHERGDVTVNLLTMRRGDQIDVAAWVEASGWTVAMISERSYLMTARLPYAAIPALAARDDVQWIDTWHPPATDMNIARTFHGADALEMKAGYTGTGVRVEVLDAGTVQDHPDMQDFIVHSPTMPTGSHGTCTSGIVVGKGIQNGKGRGAAPDAFLSMAYFGSLAGGSRYAHTGELVDPTKPYKCVLQSNSWGSGLTTAYTTISQDMDTMLFDFESLSILQSQSNTGSTSSRPQAWAKNVIAVGGMIHNNTATKSDDSWSFGASIGPAADGRVKPDLSSFYDAIFCTDQLGSLGYSNGAYFTGFGGTSGATPIVAGNLALFYEMWSEGIFRNVTPGTTPFENAPKNTTAKAVLINNASQWNFSGTGDDRTRVHQGWGHPDVERIYDQRNNMLIVDETDVLSELESTAYDVEVTAGLGKLRATLVFRDFPGTTSSSQHAINNLDLKVTSPSNVVYHGNVGLLIGKNSVPGGVPNSIDTVENVFVLAPELGTWTVEVSATDLNVDTHPETGALDADYALVISGIFIEEAAPPFAPTGLNGAPGTTAVQLNWIDNSSFEAGSTIEHSLDGATWAVVGTTGVDETVFLHTGVDPGSLNHYRLLAFNEFGSSGYSNVLVVTTLAGDPSPLQDAPYRIRR